MIINPYIVNTINPIFADVTHAWPLTEDSSSYMLREAKGSGIDFFPQNATLLSGMTKFAGNKNSYAACDGSPFRLGSDSAFMLRFNIKTVSQSGTRYIINHGEFIASSAYTTYMVTINSNNLRLQIFNASTNAYVQVAVSVGVEYVIHCGYDPVNQRITIKKDDGTPVETSWTGGTHSKFGSLTLAGSPGYWADDTRQFGGSLKNLMYFDSYLDYADQSTSYGLAFPYAALPNQSKSLDPDDLTSKVARFDFSDLSRMWQDTGKTTPVASNDDPIRVVASKWGSIEATAPSDGVRPLYKSASGSGYSNGTDTELQISQRLQSVRTPFTLILIGKNDRTGSAGSHYTYNQGLYSAASNSYITQTSAAYSSPNGYFAAHFGAGSAYNSAKLLNPTDFNILDLSGSATEYVGTVNGDQPLNEANYKITNNLPLDFDTLMKSTLYSSAWWLLGNLSEILFSEAEVSIATRARLRHYYELQRSLTNIKYYGY